MVFHAASCTLQASCPRSADTCHKRHPHPSVCMAGATNCAGGVCTRGSYLSGTSCVACPAGRTTAASPPATASSACTRESTKPCRAHACAPFQRRAREEHRNSITAGVVADASAHARLTATPQQAPKHTNPIRRNSVRARLQSQRPRLRHLPARQLVRGLRDARQRPLHQLHRVPLWPGDARCRRYVGCRLHRRARGEGGGACIGMCKRVCRCMFLACHWYLLHTPLNQRAPCQHRFNLCSLYLRHERPGLRERLHGRHRGLRLPCVPQGDVVKGWRPRHPPAGLHPLSYGLDHEIRLHDRPFTLQP